MLNENIRGAISVNKFQEMYKSKLTSADNAVKLIQNDDWIVIPIGVGEPPALLEALSERRYELEGVVTNQILALKKYKYMDPDSKILHNSWFTSGATREAVNGGWATFSANYFYEVPRLLREYQKVDVVIAVVSPMDKHGYFSMGTSLDYSRESCDIARVIIVEVNENMPRTHGNSFLHVSQVAAIVENHQPLVELGIPPITEVDEAIGHLVADLIPDGATIQIGFGGIPNAVCKFLETKRDLGIHTEMITDGMVDLINAGAVTNFKKNYHPGKLIGTFALGTKKLYDFLDDNPMIEMHSVSYTNDPVNIGKNDNMRTVNAAVEIDLCGQICSETMGTYKWSGTGGQADFSRGATRSTGGKGVITLAATAKKGTVSRVVPTLTPGAHVTTGKNDVDYVVTEYGVAHLRGKTARQRAQALINVAAPQFREELTAAAKKMFLL